MKRVIFWATTSFFALATAAACSSSSNGGDGATGNDGGGGGNEDAGGDAAQGSTDYCAAAAQFFTRCNRTTQCDKDTLAQCPQIRATMSDTYAAAFIACFPTEPCKGTGGQDDCVRGKLASATKTAAQTTLAEHVCAVCGGATCVQDFYKLGTNPTNDGTGFVLLQAGDANVKKMDSDCVKTISAGASCLGDFQACGLGIIGDSIPPDPDSCL